MSLRRLVLGLAPLLLVPLLSAQNPPTVPRDSLPATLDLTEIPLGLGPRPVPKDHPLTAARVALGRKLFFDPLLSADRTIACASCHDPARAFSHGEPRGVRVAIMARPDVASW